MEGKVVVLKYQVRIPGLRIPWVRRESESMLSYHKAENMDTKEISQEVASYYMGQSRLHRLGSALGFVKTSPRIRGFERALSERLSSTS